MKPLALTLLFLGLGSLPALAQDFQVGSRAKGMGGSYTAFDEDPVSIWLNPAGIAGAPTRMAIDYQTFTQYEVKDTGTSLGTVGEPKTGLLDPPIIPSFLGFTTPLGQTGGFQFQFGVALVRPFENRLTYVNGAVVEQTEQQFSRFRVAVAAAWNSETREGWFHSVSFGVGGDVAYSVYTENDNAGALSRSDHETAVGYGLGLLVGAYTNQSDFSVDVGVAYQSAVHFNWAIDTQFFPVWNWPAMINAGFTVKLLDKMDLRLTFDIQYIYWNEATKNDLTGAAVNFTDSTNYSFGAEYYVRLSETISLLPRAGYRLYEAPWKHKNELPAIGFNVLSIDTKGGRQNIGTFGASLQWVSDNKVRAFDFGAEVGGDAPNFAVGYRHDF
jgi:hypothetical protein